MATSGLIITWSDDAARRAGEATLSEDPRVLLGTWEGNRQAAAIATDTHAESRALLDWIGSQPGVVGLDLHCVIYEEERP